VITPTRPQHALDFWLGRWRVLSTADELLGENEIVAVLGGAAVIERWRGVDGDEGMSLFFYDRVREVWKQVWVTDRWTHKEKELVATTPGGGLVFQGTVARSRGGEHLDRTTLTPLAAGEVHQLIETSADGGATWTVGFDGRYVPVSEPSSRQAGTSGMGSR
jgi:hypothetical protein